MYGQLKFFNSMFKTSNTVTETAFSAPSQCTRDIVLVMDSSVILSVWNSLKQFAEMLAAALSNSDRNTRIGVVIYSDFGRVISQLVSYS